MKPTELIQLIKLLDDPDDRIYNTTKKTLFSLGVKVIPSIKKLQLEIKDSLFRKRTKEIIEKIHSAQNKKLLHRWLKTDEKNLLQGIYIISKFINQELQFIQVRKEIDKIVKKIKNKINKSLSPYQIIHIINNILFNEYRFSRNTENLFDPKNYSIDEIIKRKKGNALSLSVLYLIITHKLGLPVYGIDLPDNFILGFKKKTNKNETKNVFSTLFYINPVNKGIIITIEDINNYIKFQRVTYSSLHYHYSTNLDIIGQTVKELIGNYEKSGNIISKKAFEEVLKIIEKRKIYLSILS